jgi:hypothetical protein
MVPGITGYEDLQLMLRLLGGGVVGVPGPAEPVDRLHACLYMAAKVRTPQVVCMLVIAAVLPHSGVRARCSGTLCVNTAGAVFRQRAYT